MGGIEDKMNRLLGEQLQKKQDVDQAIFGSGVQGYFDR
jgi:hypothetical protein